MFLNASISAGSAIGSSALLQQPAQVIQRVGHALQKMGFALIKAAEPVGAQRLHDADIDVGIIVVQKRFALEIG